MRMPLQAVDVETTVPEMLSAAFAGLKDWLAGNHPPEDIHVPLPPDERPSRPIVERAAKANADAGQALMNQLAGLDRLGDQLAESGDQAGQSIREAGAAITAAAVAIEAAGRRAAQEIAAALAKSASTRVDGGPPRVTGDRGQSMPRAGSRLPYAGL